MIFIKLLFSSLIYMTAMTLTHPTNDEESDVMWRNALNYNLSNTILPSHYLIRVVFRPDLPYLISKYVIVIHILFATQHINFYLSNSWNISNMGLRQVCGKVNYKIKLPIYRGKNNVVMFDFDEVLVPGIYLLKMDLIHYNFGTNSSQISFIREGEEMWLMTDIQTKNQQMFPYWDIPELRIRFNISIMHHRRYTVLSNMPIQMSKQMLNNMTWTYFHRTPLMSTDSVALVVTSYYPINNVINNKTVSMLYRPQLDSQEMAFSLYFIENITRYLQNNSMWVIEKTYDLFEKKVDHVAILDLNDEVKPKLGFVFYREADIVYDENLDSIECQMRIAHLIARGIVQKYMSNLLSPSFWFDQWLNEGFKIYMETYIIEKVLPNFRVMDLFVVQVQHELLHLNTYVVINSVMDYCSYSEKYLCSSFSHVKGSILWRMLELTLSPDIFSKGIDIYLNDRFSGATTSNYLWSAMQSVMNALNYKLEFNIKTMIESWATQRYPFVLEVMRNSSIICSNTSIISIRFYNKLKEKQYYIPVTYTTESELNFTITWTNITWITPWHSQEIKLILAKDHWIIFNLQQVGYYRVYYDIENWKKIGRYLNSEEYKNIHVLNRAQIIDDAFHFAVEKKLQFSVFCEIAKYLLKERDYIAWYPMIKAFEFMSNFFVFSYYNPQFEKVLKRMKFLTLWNLFEKHNDHSECLNQEVAKWKCIADDFSCKALAHIRLLEHLINPEKNKLSPGWKRWTYCNGLKFAHNKTWNQVINNLKKIDRMILECLAYIEDHRILIHYLRTQLFDFTFYRSYRSKPTERYYPLFDYIVLFSIARNTNIQNHILDNFKYIVHGRVNKIAAIIVMINNAYSMAQLDEIKDFIGRGYGVELIFEYLIERKIETRCSEIERQIKFLHFVID